MEKPRTCISGGPEHIETLSRVDPLDFPGEWYDLNAEGHFWFRWRFEAVQNVLAALNVDLTAPARALDIGCGTGTLRDQLEGVTAWTIDGVDLRRDALTRARRGRGRLFVYDIFEQRQEFIAAYDYVFLFDVLEHIRSTGEFVDCVLRHLRPGGILFVNVPALPWLSSEYDTAAGHFRRYTVRTLREEFSGRLVQVETARYWGCSLVPLLVARKIMVRGRKDTGGIIRAGFRPPNRLLNGVLSALASVETSLLRRPPIGTSALIALRATL
jgi:2-polyprenyl-3-methyl-5-hydroxy-6-metoxy-1,4-benzoquinol methylase